MSFKLAGYYKVAMPVPVTTTMSDSQNIGDQASFTNYTFYQRLIQGSASRVIRYREYDLADHDVEIARGLDTIAEEMCGNLTADPVPLRIIHTNPLGTELTSTKGNSAVAVEAALSYWVNFHDLNTRMFGICRVAAKYGDCFFKKNAKTKTWEYIHPKNVMAAIVDEHDMTKVIGWQIKRDIKVPNSPSNPAGQPLMAATGAGSAGEFDIYGADEIVWFSLSNDMTESAPFGESVLRAVYKAQKQKELLEDSVIIYRLVRAPERRVFYVDVGKMPPQRVKAYLEQLKNEYRQRNTPSYGSESDQVDAVYNPMSTSEDIFLATRPGAQTKIDTLPAGQVTGVIADLEYFQWKVFRGLRIPMSYMSDENSAQSSDGANAFITELRFAQYIKRLQRSINKVLDKEFKAFLRQVDIKCDDSSFRVELPEPENFGIYRQQALDAERLNAASSASSVSSLSSRFVMTRYLGLTEAEVKRNERLKMEEMGLDPNGPQAYNLKMVYSSSDDPLGANSMQAGMMGGATMPDMSTDDNLGDLEIPASEDLGMEQPAEPDLSVNTPDLT